MNARERSNAAGRAARRKETLIWAGTGLLLLMLGVAYAVGLWSAGW